ncbi:MAG: type II toxin-antitoxin system RelE/ParE family toxin [Anaerolineales bacterium]
MRYINDGTISIENNLSFQFKHIVLDTQRNTLYIAIVIKSLSGKETSKIYRRVFSKHLPAAILQSALRKLWMLNNAQSVQGLRSPPGNRLEKLKGEREGQYSIRINNQWRVCYEWHESDAHHVEMADDH